MRPGVITRLRDFVPLRPLTRTEAMRIAELQALRFLKIMEVSNPSVPERLIEELPRFQVERVNLLPASGASKWVHGRWMIVLRASEPLTRQRFSLVHEFKHVLDSRFAKLLYGGIDAADRHDFIEGICDYFAGSLLVPRPWLKQAWAEGTQRIPDLAQCFGVSEAAIEVRLTQTGLAPPRPRHQPASSPLDWSRINLMNGRATYYRSLHPVGA